MYQQILLAIPAIIVSLFLGPWSDRNGRKPLMVVPMIGTIVSQLIYIANTYFSHWSAYYILLTGIGCIFGGFTAFLIGIYSYVSDVSGNRSRTSRIALLDLFVFLGFPVGTYLSGPIFKYSGYYGVFGSAIALTFGSMLYTMVMIKDTRGPFSDQGAGQSFEVCNAFSIFNVIEVFKVCFKRRENHGRAIILLLIGAMLFNVSTLSSSSIVYLFSRLKFDWSEQEFTIWMSLSTVASSLFTFGVIPIVSYKMKLHDALIGTMGAIFGIGKNVIWTLATSSWMMYLGSAVGLLSTAASIVIRAHLSKVAPADELGAIFSLLASLEAAVPLMTSPLMTLVYNSTLTTFPGAIMLLSAGLYVAITINLSIVYLLFKKYNSAPSSQNNHISGDTEPILDNEEEPSVSTE